MGRVLCAARNALTGRYQLMSGQSRKRRANAVALISGGKNTSILPRSSFGIFAIDSMQYLKPMVQPEVR